MYEIKANISRDDAAALAAAGIRWVQPGVESFSDHILELMRKGTTGALNIQLLKWLKEFGITPYYNLLVGFPGEVDADYEEMIAVLPSLYHLTPPVRSKSMTVSVHRFAPFFNEPERWGIRGTRPAWYYRHLIPPKRAPAEDFAFFFDRDIPADAPMHRHRKRLDAALARWERARRTLKASLGAGFISILRASGSRETEIANLRDAEASVFLLCDTHTTTAKLSRDLAALRPGAEPGVEAIVANLIRLGLVVALRRAAGWGGAVRAAAQQRRADRMAGPLGCPAQDRRGRGSTPPSTPQPRRGGLIRRRPASTPACWRCARRQSGADPRGAR